MNAFVRDSVERSNRKTLRRLRWRSRCRKVSMMSKPERRTAMLMLGLASTLHHVACSSCLFKGVSQSAWPAAYWLWPRNGTSLLKFGRSLHEFPIKLSLLESLRMHKAHSSGRDQAVQGLVLLWPFVTAEIYLRWRNWNCLYGDGLISVI